MCRAYGSPDRHFVEKVPSPVPGPGEVLVTIHASGINYADQLLIEGRTHLDLRPPFTPGLEAAGVVKAVGLGVDRIKVGQRVIASGTHGGYAQEGVFRVEEVCVMPRAMPFAVGAGFFVASMTSHYALVERAKLQADETLLVLGAAGGVGLTAVEIGKAIGAKVVACASSDEKLAIAQEHGAHVLYKYPPGPLDVAAQKRMRTDLKGLLGTASGFDVIYDPVGGDYAEPALRTIARRGRYLVIGFAAGIPRIPLDIALSNNCEILGITLTRAPQAGDDYVSSAKAKRELLRLFNRGKLRPHVSAEYPLEQFGEALAALGGRRATGRIVLLPQRSA